MTLELLPVFDHLDGYISETKSGNTDVQALWEKYAIEPYWSKLSKYAPFDISDRKPKPVLEVTELEKRVQLLKQLNWTAIHAAFEKAVAALPDYDDTMYIGIYPLLNPSICETQNGVWGNCTWGNMIINIDPVASDYALWVPYVFAHEYHHNIWGNNWFNERKGELNPIFLNDLLSDGLADSFALSLNPELRPKWLFDMSSETEKHLWCKHYAHLVKQADVNYPKYMFGDEKEGIPWCAGYAIGFRIVQQYIRSHPQTSMTELLDMTPSDIFTESGYPDF